jgi:hypothetical protein
LNVAAGYGGALRYLLGRSWANTVRRKVARLRQPRYAIALIVGASYFIFLFAPRGDDPPFSRETVELVAGLSVALFLAWSWLWGGHRDALAFSPAETDLLLPAPIPRTALIRYKLLKGQLGLVLSAAMFTLLTQGRGPPWWLRLPALWVLLTTMNLHKIAASLVHTSAEQQGRVGVRRNALAILLFLAAAGALAYALVESLPALRAATDPATLRAAAGGALRHPAALAATYPVRLMLAPTFAESPDAWARAMVPALLLLALHFAWVLRSDAAFEEAAVEAGERRAARLAAARAGRTVHHTGRDSRRRIRWSPPIPRGGPPHIALVWKNVVTFTRGLQRNVLLMLVIIGIAVFAGAASSMEAKDEFFDAISGTAIAFSALLTLVGPLVIRNDLRRDLGHLHLLRAMPLAGRAIVGAEIASSALTLTAFQLPLLAAGIAAGLVGETLAGDYGTALLLMACGILVLPVLNALATMIQNALVLMFPAWSRIGDERAPGFEQFGQQIITFLGTLILLLLALVPPALVGALAAGVVLLAGAGPIAAAVVGLAVGTAGGLAEVLLAIGVLGRVFDRLDPIEAGIAGT